LLLLLIEQLSKAVVGEAVVEEDDEEEDRVWAPIMLFGFIMLPFMLLLRFLSVFEAG
jgi:hypothetical protein